jgi:integrase
LRPSEITGLMLAHVTRHADGIELFLPWRKNDQDARGTRLWVPKGRTHLCPVTASEAWLAAASITEGPLFRTDSIALIVKNWTGLAGFDAAAFAGHSLRRGAISSGVAQGVHIARLKQFSGHASLKSLEEYIELDELRQNHPLKDVL